VREKHEAEFARIMGGLFAEQKKRLIARLQDPFRVVDDVFWADESSIFLVALMPLAVKLFRESAMSSFNEALTMKQAIPPHLEGTILERAIDFAKQFGFELVQRITDTTRRAIQKGLTKFFTIEGFTLGDFVRLLAEYDAFSPSRATMIAITETTRAYSEAGELVSEEMRGYGIDFEEVWFTANDEMVCVLCGPLHNTVRGDM